MEASALPTEDRKSNSTDHLAAVDRSGEKTLAELVRSEMLTKAETRNKMLALRRLGMTAAQISAELLKSDGIQVDPSTVTRTINRHLEQIAREDRESTEALRALEDERLDGVLRGHMDKAIGGDEKSARIVIKASERRAKMHGLDAPQEVNHNVNGSILHELGVDPDEIKREREAFEASFGRAGLSDPADNIIEGRVVEDEPEDFGSADS